MQLDVNKFWTWNSQRVYGSTKYNPFGHIKSVGFRLGCIVVISKKKKVLNLKQNKINSQDEVPSRCEHLTIWTSHFSLGSQNWLKNSSRYYNDYVIKKINNIENTDWKSTFCIFHDSSVINNNMHQQWRYFYHIDLNMQETITTSYCCLVQIATYS